MSDKMKELIEIPQDFIRDGNQVRLASIDSLVKELMRTSVHSSSHGVPSLRKRVRVYIMHTILTEGIQPLYTEFLQICKAVAIGFAVMGFIGYFVKLIHIPMCVSLSFNGSARALTNCFLPVTTSLCTFPILYTPYVCHRPSNLHTLVFV